MKLVNYELKKVQITCPNCKYEFPYNKAALQKKINQLGNKIQELMRLKKTLKNIPEEKLNKEELKRIDKQLDNYQQTLSDLKLIRETLKEQEDIFVFQNLKAVLKEFYGDEGYKRCMDEALRRSSAYNTEDMMSIGYYSKADGKHIKKVS